MATDPDPEPTSPHWRDRVQRARAAAAERVGTWCAPVWNDRRLGVAVEVVVAAVWGTAAGRWTPRGPLTTTEALWSIVLSLVVGGLAGLVSRTRWAALGAPAAFAVVFELVRIDTSGPTVDGIHTSTYGLIALAVGRGFHALVALLPLAYGALLGAGAARSLAPSAGGVPTTWTGRARQAGAVVAALGLLAFSLVLARPASTEAIVDDAGDVVPGRIAELATIEVNGNDLGLMLRGHDVDHPVVLFLAGGPGGSERGAMRNHLAELEEHFTVATWDQRGTGTSYDELDPTGTLTLDAMVDDTIAVTEYLVERFDQDRIVVLGQSWGTLLGVLAVQERPDLYAAYVGTGQMVDVAETDRIIYEDTLAWAEAEGDDELADELRSNGPPPYDRMLDYEPALAHEHDVYPYDHAPNSEGESGFSENLFVPEYTLIDQVHLLGAFLDTFSVLYPQVQEIDLRRSATSFDVPVVFVQGAHEADGRSILFDEWYPMVEAPAKELIVLDTSGHRPLFEQPDEFVDVMVGTVAPLLER